MNSRWKVYNTRLICSFITILIVLISINVLVNPFEIFNIPKIKRFNFLKPDKDRNQRITKIVSLKLEKRPIEAVFLGSSRVNSTVSENYYYEKTGKIAKNLGMNALSHDETIKIAQNVVKIHPEIKTIYLGLDFFRFLEKIKDNKRDVIISNNPQLTISEFNPLILSFNTTLASFNTVIANLRYKENKTTNIPQAFKTKLKQYAKNYSNAQLADNEILKIKAFKTDMKYLGYDVVLYTNPVHVLDLILIDKMGYLPLFFEWKEKMANEFEYIDFAVVNDLTAEKVDDNTKYFAESSHATNLTGNVIIEKLVFNSNNYGISANSSNIKIINLKSKKDITKWLSANACWNQEIEKVLDEMEEE